MIVKNDRCGILDGKEVGTDSELLDTRALLGLFYFMFKHTKVLAGTV